MLDSEKVKKLRNFLLPVLAGGVCLCVLSVFLLSPDLYESAWVFVSSFLPGQRVEVIRDVKYSQVGSRALTGDLYMVHSSKPRRPAIVLIHGGSWAKGDKYDYDEIESAEEFASRGYVAFVIDLRLAGNGGEFPNDIIDAASAMAYLVKNKERWQIDPSAIIVGGSSSGGSTALMVGYALPQMEPYCKDDDEKAKLIALASLKPKAVISFSGPTILTDFPENPHLIAYIESYLTNLSGRSYRDRCAIASAINYAKTAIPTILVHGDKDQNVPYRHSAELARALAVQKIPCRMITVEGSDHMIGMRSRRLVIDQALTFINGLSPNQP